MNKPPLLYRFITISVFISTSSLVPTLLFGAQSNPALPRTVEGERIFSSQDEAIQTLQSAVEAKNQIALHQIFGPELDELLTGDDVQDAHNLQKFATAMGQHYQLVKEGDDTYILEVGANHYPMPIPLVRVNGQWHFDTAAGKEEIINRHIGRDELHAIGVCRAYVRAQREYAHDTEKLFGVRQYALRFKSTPGQKDGLYWATLGNETQSPFGPLVAEAHIEGYPETKGTGPHPYHGYYFRILTGQGESAPGGKRSYLTNGKMTTGFALVAYPEHWDKSGIMTLIVNQDGKVYQRNFAEKTADMATRMEEYNPDHNWVFVEEAGVLNTAPSK